MSLPQHRSWSIGNSQGLYEAQAIRLRSKKTTYFEGVMSKRSLKDSVESWGFTALVFLGAIAVFIVAPVWVFLFWVETYGGVENVLIAMLKAFSPFASMTVGFLVWGWLSRRADAAEAKFGKGAPQQRFWSGTSIVFGVASIIVTVALMIIHWSGGPPPTDCSWRVC